MGITLYWLHSFEVMVPWKEVWGFGSTHLEEMQFDQCHNSAGSSFLCTSTLKLFWKNWEPQNIHFFHTSDEFVKISNKLAAPFVTIWAQFFNPLPGDIIYGCPSYQSWSKAAKQAGRREKKKLTLLLRSHKSWLPNRQTKLSRLLNTVQSFFLYPVKIKSTSRV